jgi:hypothetical protein
VGSKRSRSESQGGKRSKRKALVVSGVVAICLALAIPLYLPGAPPVEIIPRTAGANMSAPTTSSPAPTPVDPKAGPVSTSRPPDRRKKTGFFDGPEKAPVNAAIATSPDGDLALSMKLRWTEFETGDRVLAKVKFSNHSERSVFVPAAGEPNPGLAIVIEDAEGNEVRRVVESAKGDQFPRRLTRVAAGAEVSIPVTLIDENETTLEPGTYAAHVEMKADPRLVRLGVPVWMAPKGTVLSEPVPLVVKARPAK